MGAWAQLGIEFKANVANITQGIAQVNSQLGSLGKSINALKGVGFVYLGQQALNAFRQVSAFTEGMARLGEEIEQNAQKMGVSIETYQRFAYSAKLNELGSEDLIIATRGLSQELMASTKEGSEAANALKSMGISAKDISGNIKPLDQILYEISDKFASWKDGAAKAEYAVALFSRAGLNMIPWLNQGSTAIKGMGDEAQKMGAILGVDTVKRLDESKNSFEKFGAVMTAFKVDILSPAVEKFAALLETILKLKATLEGTWKFQPTEQQSKTLYDYLKKVGQVPPEGYRGEYEEMFKEFEMGPQTTPAWIKEWVAKYEAKKMTPPKLEKTADISKMMQKDLEDTAKAWGDYAQEELDALEKLVLLGLEQRKLLDNVEKTELEMHKLNAEAEELSRLGKMPDWRESLEDLPKGFMDIEDRIISIQDYLDALNAEAPEWVKKWANPVDEMEGIFKSFGQDLSSAWSNNLTNMVRGTQSFADTVKNIFASIADSFISAVAKMLVNWMLFQNIKGEYEEGKGILGLIGGVLKGVSGATSVAGGYGNIGAGVANTPGILGNAEYVPYFQHGGIVRGPTLGMVGESGPEAVIPLKGGKVPIEGGGNNYYTFIEATDVQSFEKRYGSVIESIYYRGKRFNKMSMR